MLNKEIAENKLKELTNHKHVNFTDRCNSAIFIAMSITKRFNDKQTILIPDQGGWFSYKKYPKYFNLNIVEVKTDYGIIDIEDLKTKVTEASAFIFSSFAGYFAEQPLEEISNICREADCLVIEDASGSIGDKMLCNGEFSDIIVGSFGNWKPVEVGYGGFISFNNNKFLEVSKDALSLTKVPPTLYEGFLKQLIHNKLPKLLELQSKVKEDLKDYVIHPEKRGLNVVTEYDPMVINYCKENRYEIVECPRYIRVNKKAISIELKRLNL